MIGAGMRITSVDEFNRRALPALRGLPTSPRQHGRSFVQGMIRVLEQGMAITEAEQLALYRVVRDRREQITDELLVDYALNHVKGYW